MKTLKHLVTIMVATGLLCVGISGGEAAPVPDVKFNCTDGPASVAAGDATTIRVSLQVGNTGGSPADWYVVAVTPDGPMYLSGELFSWIPWPPDMPPSFSGMPLFDLEDFPLDGIVGLDFTPGQYAFIFGVDTNPDGMLTLEELSYDLALVELVDEASDLVGTWIQVRVDGRPMPPWAYVAITYNADGTVVGRGRWEGVPCVFSGTYSLKDNKLEQTYTASTCPDDLLEREALNVTDRYNFLVSEGMMTWPEQPTAGGMLVEHVFQRCPAR